MAHETVTLDCENPQQAALLRQYHAYLTELAHVADTAPDGTVLDALEDRAVARGRDVLRASLQTALQRRLDTAEKKMLPCGPAAPADTAAKTAVPRRARSRRR
jgi:hypothetical protein